MVSDESSVLHNHERSSTEIVLCWNSADSNWKFESVSSGNVELIAERLDLGTRDNMCSSGKRRFASANLSGEEFVTPFRRKCAR